MNLEECKTEAAKLRSDHEKDIERRQSCDRERSLIWEEIQAVEKERESYLANAKQANASSGNALKNAEKALISERAAKNLEPQIAAKKAKLAEMPAGNHSSIRYKLNSALKSKLSTLMQARKKHLSDTYARWGLYITAELWNIIPIGGSNDSLTGLRWTIEDNSAWTVDTAEQYLKLLEEELE